jgi:hypothetical protein
MLTKLHNVRLLCLLNHYSIKTCGLQILGLTKYLFHQCRWIKSNCNIPVTVKHNIFASVCIHDENAYKKGDSMHLLKSGITSPGF